MNTISLRLFGALALILCVFAVTTHAITGSNIKPVIAHHAIVVADNGVETHGGKGNGGGGNPPRRA